MKATTLLMCIHTNSRLYRSDIGFAGIVPYIDVCKVTCINNITFAALRYIGFGIRL